MISRAYYEDEADTILTAIVGAAGIRATTQAIQLGMKVALANKETLVTAGPMIQQALLEARQNEKKSVMIPVDSEHNSLFRLIYREEAEAIRRLILTASGGPFVDLSVDELACVTKEQVLKHPTWSMGAKITVDSAGMINKGLEVIETHYLFAAPYENIGVCIHRNSLVHAMLEFCDGSYTMHTYSPDMVFSIAHALFFPENVAYRHPQADAPPEWPVIHFEELSKDKYPGFYLCMEAGKAGGNAPAVFNGANEAAVAAFLADRIHFTQIAEVIDSVMDCAPIDHGSDLELFLEADAWGRKQAEQEIAKGTVAK